MGDGVQVTNIKLISSILFVKRKRKKKEKEQKEKNLNCLCSGYLLVL